MDQQKVVVILLLITIILAVASIIISLSVSGDTYTPPKRSVVDNPISQSNVAFEIATLEASGGGG